MAVRLDGSLVVPPTPDSREKVRAIAAWDAQDEFQLSFDAGEVITILDKFEGNPSYNGPLPLLLLLSHSQIPSSFGRSRSLVASPAPPRLSLLRPCLLPLAFLAPLRSFALLLSQLHFNCLFVIILGR